MIYLSKFNPATVAEGTTLTHSDVVMFKPVKADGTPSKRPYVLQLAEMVKFQREDLTTGKRVIHYLESFSSMAEVAAFADPDGDTFKEFVSDQKLISLEFKTPQFEGQKAYEFAGNQIFSVVGIYPRSVTESQAMEAYLKTKQQSDAQALKAKLEAQIEG